MPPPSLSVPSLMVCTSAFGVVPAVTAGVERRRREFSVRSLLAPVRRAFGVGAVTRDAIRLVYSAAAGDQLGIESMRNGRRWRSWCRCTTCFYRSRFVTARGQQQYDRKNELVSLFISSKPEAQTGHQPQFRRALPLGTGKTGAAAVFVAAFDADGPARTRAGFRNATVARAAASDKPETAFTRGVGLAVEIRLDARLQESTFCVNSSSYSASNRRAVRPFSPT